MKTITTKLILLSSLALMTACSTHSVKPEKQAKKLTALQILGINNKHSKKASPLVLAQLPKPIELLPMAKTYPMIEEQWLDSEPIVSDFTNSNTLIDSYTLKDTSPIAVEVENDAKSLLGIKYVWGATGPYTYDCSGFTQKVYRDAGINIPRVSRDQARVGQYISYNNLKKGDMVFFDTKKRRSGKVSHVGIYLGNGNFIHASSGAKKVVIFNFNEKQFYKKRFLWGRRVIRDNYFTASL